jgi:hypothetical protein
MGNWNQAPKSIHIRRLIFDDQRRLVVGSFIAALSAMEEDRFAGFVFMVSD